MDGDEKDTYEKALARFEADPWNEDKLPDCRLHENNRPIVKSERYGHMAEVFCANCHKETGGFVTNEWARKIFYLCPNCEKWGRVPGLKTIPEAVVRGEEPLIPGMPIDFRFEGDVTTQIAIINGDGKILWNSAVPSNGIPHSLNVNLDGSINTTEGQKIMPPFRIAVVVVPDDMETPVIPVVTQPSITSLDLSSLGG
jgi:hypothetical protein